MMGEGTVNDEELVEVVAEKLGLFLKDEGSAEWVAVATLNHLRSAGFQVFKPEDCEWVVKDEEFIADQDSFLVPIPGGRDER